MTALDTISTIALVVGVIQTGVITVDIVRRPQQMMPIMNVVWPLVGLYFPAVGLVAYGTLGRAPAFPAKVDRTGHVQHTAPSDETGVNAPTAQTHHGHHHAPPAKPFWQSVFVSTTHCSSGCSLGDMIGAPIVFWLGLTLLASTLFAEYVVEFGLAYLFGIAFQYYGMGFKTPDNPGATLKAAIKSDTLSLICFEIGMFGWMALVHNVFFVTNVPQPNTAVFWFMMQLAMMIGFGTSYPANWVLVRKGIKHAM